MTKRFNRLTQRRVDSLSRVGMHADGWGLYLIVSPRGAKRWEYLYQWEGRRREMSLGSAAELTLEQARKAALEARRLVYAGKDPLAVRHRPTVVAATVDQTAIPTFGDEAEALITQLSLGWRSAKQAKLWRGSLEIHAKSLWHKPVNEIGTDDILEVLRPIWTEKAETAGKVRGRIERVLAAATVKGHRTGDNPAVWDTHLRHLLSPRKRLQYGHRKAMPYQEAPAFIQRLRTLPGHPARALRFTILTAAREAEVLGATWAEIDTEQRLWRIPPKRTKTGAEHIIPLSDPAMELIGKPGQPGELLFPGARRAKLSNVAMDLLLRGLHPDATVHGFRSTFRDWAGDMTDTPREIAEAALAHRVGNAVELAYRRSTAVERRRELMQAWGSYLHQPPKERRMPEASSSAVA